MFELACGRAGLRKDGCAIAILIFIDNGNRVVKRIGRNNDENRSEDFIYESYGFWILAQDDGRLDEEASGVISYELKLAGLNHIESCNHRPLPPARISPPASFAF